MIVLGIDTALAALSAAVVKEGVALAHDWREMPRGHAEALAPMVDRLMHESGIAFSDLDRIAVTTGPGTFAGQRVGIAFARGLALATGKPAVGVTTLDAMAEAALAQCPDADWAVAIHDARRDEVYLGARSRSGKTPIAAELIPVERVPARLAEAASHLGPAPALAGTAAEAIAHTLSSANLRPALSTVRQPDALYVARLGAQAPVGAPPRPLYLRPPDARLPAPAIRTAMLADAPALARLHAACFADAWDAAAMLRLMDRANALAFIAGDDAFILVQVAAGEAEILALATKPSARRRGLARALLSEAARAASRAGARMLFLEAAEDNEAALRLYRGLGFRDAGRRAAYYVRKGSPPADAILLRSSLPL